MDEEVKAKLVGVVLGQCDSIFFVFVILGQFLVFVLEFLSQVLEPDVLELGLPLFGGGLGQLGGQLGLLFLVSFDGNAGGVVNDALEVVFLEFRDFVFVNVELFFKGLNFFFELKDLLAVVLFLFEHAGFEHLDHLLVVLCDGALAWVFFLPHFVVLQKFSFQLLPLLFDFFQLFGQFLVVFSFC